MPDDSCETMPQNNTRLALFYEMFASTPTVSPSSQHSDRLTVQPALRPSHHPASTPTVSPSSQHSDRLTVRPALRPSHRPASTPTVSPSSQHSDRLTVQPALRSSHRPASTPTHLSSFSFRPPTVSTSVHRLLPERTT
ncbi:hypothetical protein BV898_15710 [Hypsibius exemplaris]|uniref:Uncharacterized protein n=1 Tax=Hypsibius exemplaris TaxID=2072580 RepID=A0A9X6RL05_HYPEX|nr:hypothetical protein BV898_15710 [Hypsibius exemplaris]